MEGRERWERKSRGGERSSGKVLGGIDAPGLLRTLKHFFNSLDFSSLSEI